MAVGVVDSVVSNSLYTDIAFYLSITAAMVSIATFVVGYTQMRIASAKVRLDLYNKRFNVYLSALGYYQSAWGKVGDFDVKAAEFIKCYRESQFLFSKKDGVYDTLTKIKDYGGVISAKRDLEEDDKATNRSNASALHDKCEDARRAMGDELQVLENQIAKYIDFKVVRGWSAF